MFGIKAAVVVLYAPDELVVAVPLGKQNGVGHGVRQKLVGFSRPNGFERIRRGADADGPVAFAVGDHVVILAGARRFPHQGDGFVDGLALLHHFADELGHGQSIPVPRRASPHLADGQAVFVHRGNGSDKAGVADIDPGVVAIGADDGDDGVLLQSHPAQVVQDAAVIEAPVFGGFAAQEKNPKAGVAFEPSAFGFGQEFHLAVVRDHGNLGAVRRVEEIFEHTDTVVERHILTVNPPE